MRWIRGILYFAAGCTGIGIAALILAFVLGGENIRLDAMEDVRSVTEKVTQLESRGSSSGTDAGNGKSWTYESTEVKNLSVSVKRGELQMEDSGSDKIVVELSASEEAGDVSVTCENGMLLIEDQRSGRNYKNISIILKLPQKQFSSLEFSIHAGKLSIEPRLQAQEIVLNADAGEIDATCLSAEDFTAEVGAGSITIQEAYFKNAFMECGMGSMELAAEITGDSSVTCGMGDVEIELLNGIDSLNFEISCGMGTVEVAGKAYSGLAKKAEIDSGADALLTLECGMGDIQIK